MDAWKGIVCVREEESSRNGEAGERRGRRGGSRGNGTQGGDGDADDEDGDEMMMMMTGHQPSVPDCFDDHEDGGEDDEGEARTSKAQYLIKHSVTSSHLFVYLSDGRNMWSAVLSRGELDGLNAKFNPSVEIDAPRLLRTLSTYIFGGDTNSTTYRLKRAAAGDEDEDDEGEEDNEDGAGAGADDESFWACNSLTLTADTLTPARVKLHWETTLVKGTLEDAFEHLTAPIMSALAVNLKYTQALEGHIRRLERAAGSKSKLQFDAELEKHAQLVDGAWIEAVPFQKVFSPACCALYKRAMLRLHPDQEPSTLDSDSKKSSLAAYAAPTYGASADLLQSSYMGEAAIRGSGGDASLGSSSLLRSSDAVVMQPSAQPEAAVDVTSPPPTTRASGVEESPLEPAFAPKKVERRAVGKRKTNAEDEEPASTRVSQTTGEPATKKKKKKKKRDLL